ncbi:MAG: hypothetical protein PHY80_00880 [Rickettsiales bacterium]|nr:hypothetical protein [Rickettsiales bacterium]
MTKSLAVRHCGVIFQHHSLPCHCGVRFVNEMSHSEIEFRNRSTAIHFSRKDFANSFLKV